VSGQLHATAVLPPWKSPRYPTEWRICELQNRSGRGGHGKILSLQGSELRSLSQQPVAIHKTYTLLITRLHLSLPSFFCKYSLLLLNFFFDHINLTHVIQSTRVSVSQNKVNKSKISISNSVRLCLPVYFTWMYYNAVSYTLSRQISTVREHSTWAIKKLRSASNNSRRKEATRNIITEGWESTAIKWIIFW
jgi:hypothetical protein